MKIIGVDYGRRRIGVAAGHSGGVAGGLCVIDRNKTPNAAAALAKIITDESADGERVGAVVFGLPLGPSDEETAMSLEVREFAAAVSSLADVGVFFIDESFTSKKAAALAMNRKKKARRDKSLSDRIAACLILQDYIDNVACE